MTKNSMQNRKQKENQREVFSESFTQDLDSIIAKEDDYIRKHRAVLETKHPEDDGDGIPVDTWGLCISGGGIRSSTLGLGALQKFMREDVFKYFDYLSTVSGGGFIGSCLTSLLSEPEGDEEQNAKLKVLGEFDEEEEKKRYYKLSEESNEAASKDISLGVGRNNAPFLSRGKYIKDQTTFTPKHQLHHLLVHGEYLTRNQSWFSLDIKRFLSALLGGAISNILLFFLLAVMGVSFVMVLLQILGTDHIFNHIITEENIGNDPISGFLKNLGANQYRIGGITFFIGFIFTFLYYWISKNFILENVNPLKKHNDSLRYKFKKLFVSFRNIGELSDDGNRRMLYRNIYQLINYSLIKFFRIFIPDKDTRTDSIDTDEVDANVNVFDYLVKKVVGHFAYWTIGVSAIVITSVVIVQRFQGDGSDSFFLIFILPIFFALGSLFFLMILGAFPNVDPNYDRLVRSVYAGMYGGAFTALVAAFIIPFLIIGIFFYGGKYFSTESPVYGLVASATTYFFAAKGLSGLSKMSAFKGIFERILPGLQKLVLNLSIFIFLFLLFHMIARQIMYNFDWLDQYLTTNYLEGQNSSFLFIYCGVAIFLSYTFTKIRSWKFIIVYFMLSGFILLLTLTLNDKMGNGLMEQAPLFVLILIMGIALLVGYVFTTPHGFVINFVIAIAIILFLVLAHLNNFLSLNFISHVELTPAVFFIGSLLFILLLGFFVLRRYRSTLLTFYQDRLTEAFLITDGLVDRSLNAPARAGQPLDTMRNHENLLLQDMGENNFRGPYHLLLASLNLRSDYTQLRKDLRSEHFIFSKYFVGSKSTGFVETEKYNGGRTTLAEAMTLSAAAVNSAMGSMGFFATTFLLTLFNLRLGKWIKNPWSYAGISEFEHEKSRRFNRLSYLIAEYTGNFSTRKQMVNVSDGGHTGDNISLLPLLRRRCSTIVVCDFEEDLDFAYESFNTVLRLAYLEEGIWIDIDLTKLTPTDKDKKTETEESVAIGTIYYPDNIRGEIIYIKSSISGEVATNVRSYSRRNPNFPHQSTADQYFNNEQFEAYRSLGYDLAESSIEHIQKIRKARWEEDSYGERLENMLEE